MLQPSETPWAEYQIQRAVPSPRFGHSANYITARDGELFIMGGIREMDILNDLWVIDTNTLTGYQLVTGGAKVGPRVGHAALVLGNAHIVFGGDTKLEETDPLDDNLYLLNTTSLRWTAVQPVGPRPSGRYGHSLSSINARLYVFGGQVDEEFFDDMWSFDLTTWRSSTTHWELVKPSTTPPPPRTNHTVVTWQDKLYLFGGANGDLWYSDTWAFDPATKRWDQLECSGYVPAPCQGHAATIIGDVMYVFGGMSSQGLLIDQLFALKLTTLKWYTFQNLGPGPSPRSGHSLTAFGGDKILVWGGTDQGNSAYVLDVSRINYPDEGATGDATPSTKSISNGAHADDSNDTGHGISTDAAAAAAGAGAAAAAKSGIHASPLDKSAVAPADAVASTNASKETDNSSKATDAVNTSPLNSANNTPRKEVRELQPHVYAPHSAETSGPTQARINPATRNSMLQSKRRSVLLPSSPIKDLSSSNSGGQQSSQIQPNLPQTNVPQGNTPQSYGSNQGALSAVSENRGEPNRNDVKSFVTADSDEDDNKYASAVDLSERRSADDNELNNGLRRSHPHTNLSLRSIDDEDDDGNATLSGKEAAAGAVGAAGAAGATGYAADHLGHSNEAEKSATSSGPGPNVIGLSDELSTYPNTPSPAQQSADKAPNSDLSKTSGAVGSEATSQVPHYNAQNVALQQHEAQHQQLHEQNVQNPQYPQSPEDKNLPLNVNKAADPQLAQQKGEADSSFDDTQLPRSASSPKGGDESVGSIGSAGVGSTSTTTNTSIPANTTSTGAHPIGTPASGTIERSIPTNTSSGYVDGPAPESTGSDAPGASVTSADAASEIATLRKQLDAYRQRDLDQEHHKLLSNNSQYQRDLSGLRDEHGQLTRKHAITQSQNADLKQRYEQLERQMSGHVTALATQQRALDEANSKLRSQQDDLAQAALLKSENADLKMKLQTAESARRHAEEQLEAVNQSYGSLKSAHSDLSARHLASKGTSNGTDTRGLDDSQQDLKTEIDHLNALWTQFLQTDKPASASDDSGYRSLYEEQKAAAARAHQDLESALREQHQLKEQLRELSAIQASSPSNADVSQLKAQHSSALSGLQNTHTSKLRELSNNHESTLKDLRSKHDSAVKELSSGHESTLKELTGHHESRFNDLNTRHEATLRDITAHNASIEDLRARLKKVEGQFQELQSEYGKALDLSRNQQVALTKTREELNMSRAHAQRLEEQLEDASLQNSSQTQDGQLTGDVSHTSVSSARNDQAALVIRDLRAQVVILEEEMQGQREQIRNLKKAALTQ